MIEQTAFDDPPGGRGVDRFAKLLVQRGGFNRAQTQPPALANENLRAERKRLPSAVVLRTFKMETDFLAFEDPDARAFAEKERPQCRSQGGAVFVVGKKALDQWDENDGQVLGNLEGVRHQAVAARGAMEKRHDYSPAGQTGFGA
jgi:hypothetical protein